MIRFKMAGDMFNKSHGAATLAAAIWAAACVSGCSQEGSMPAAGSAAPHVRAAGAVKKGPTADELTAGMAAAPALGKSLLPVELKFELTERPRIGQPLAINLALLPQIPGGPATVALTAAPGLDAAQGESQFDIPELQVGEVYRHTLQVTPTTDGVLLVNLMVSLKHDEVSESKEFAVPIIVDPAQISGR